MTLPGHGKWQLLKLEEKFVFQKERGSVFDLRVCLLPSLSLNIQPWFYVRVPCLCAFVPVWKPEVHAGCFFHCPLTLFSETRSLMGPGAYHFS